MYLSAGKDYVSADGSAAEGYVNSPEVVKTTAYLAELIAKGYANVSPIQDEFLNGASAGIMNGMDLCMVCRWVSDWRRKHEIQNNPYSTPRPQYRAEAYPYVMLNILRLQRKAKSQNPSSVKALLNLAFLVKMQYNASMQSLVSIQKEVYTL